MRIESAENCNVFDELQEPDNFYHRRHSIAFGPGRSLHSNTVRRFSLLVDNKDQLPLHELSESFEEINNTIDQNIDRDIEEERYLSGVLAKNNEIRLTFDDCDSEGILTLLFLWF